MPDLPRRRFRAIVAAAAVAVAVAVVLNAAPALAHGFSSTAYVDVTSPETGHVRAELGLEYDLLVVSVADYERNDPLFRQGNAAFEVRDSAAQAAALDTHAGSVVKYVTGRFGVTAQGQACTPTQDGHFAIEERDGVPYARLVLDYRCAAADSHEVHSGLFPDSEGYVRDTKTIVTYDLDLTSGSAALDARQPSFSTQQSWAERFWEFFQLGAEHLLTGLDHILFLLALIAGSRRLREIVLAATTFTLAHSVTFILAALGLVRVPASFVEPAIALSIAVVAAWPLWRLWRRGSHATDLEAAESGRLSLEPVGECRPRLWKRRSRLQPPCQDDHRRVLRGFLARTAPPPRIGHTSGGAPAVQGTSQVPLSDHPPRPFTNRLLDRAGWARLAVVFCFGLVHGLGFAEALGIDEAWSWTLLWSLLVFNLGIEVVQLAIIAVVFPLLALLRHRLPVARRWTTGVISAGVSVMGVAWFVQRIFGL
ncbi:HupE/UreJ family protein [Saccharopolyspora pogona]|uniref:HupE/UreJ family protein n=1 Tax=Saccharopolyspora pogona TaxID=333966 RepID=UPI001681FC82|nr:HupE/UreJ family protein [Saccharopolyspora pogona]